MIKFEEVTAGHIKSLSFEIKEGSVCKIISSSEDEKRELVNIILGLQKPISGKVFLFGKDIYSIPEKDCINFFKRIGVILEDGGVISNLKVWENITLAVWYHMGKKPADTEDKIIDIFEQIGINPSYLIEYMGKLPGPLPTYQKKIIGLVKSMLMEPELMLYDSIFEGMDIEMINRLIRLTEKFHLEKSGRTSVYITSSELSMKDVKADTILKISSLINSHRR